MSGLGFDWIEGDLGFTVGQHTLAEPPIIAGTDLATGSTLVHSISKQQLHFLEDTLVLITSRNEETSVAVRPVTLVQPEEEIPVAIATEHAGEYQRDETELT